MEETGLVSLCRVGRWWGGWGGVDGVEVVCSGAEGSGGRGRKSQHGKICGGMESDDK